MGSTVKGIGWNVSSEGHITECTVHVNARSRSRLHLVEVRMFSRTCFCFFVREAWLINNIVYGHSAPRTLD